jgi:hypothetical protein
MSYQLQRNVVASWPIKFIKGARHGLKRPAQVTMQQMQKKDLNMKSQRRKHLNGFSTQNGKLKKSKFKTGKRF